MPCVLPHDVHAHARQCYPEAHIHLLHAHLVSTDEPADDAVPTRDQQCCHHWAMAHIPRGLCHPESIPKRAILPATLARPVTMARQATLAR